MRQSLYKLLVRLNGISKDISKANGYYAPYINLDNIQSEESLINELHKASVFLRIPELSYLKVYLGDENMRLFVK
jgi:hypothetical protein